MPYGGPIVEADALIGVKCIACLERCQNQHPSSANKTLAHVCDDFVVGRGEKIIWAHLRPFLGRWWRGGGRGVATLKQKGILNKIDSELEIII